MATVPTPPGSKDRKRRNRRTRFSFLVTFQRGLREWWVEIVIALLVILAVFLLVERMNIRQTLYALLVGLVAGLEDTIGSLIQNARDFIRDTTLSDLTAYVLLLVVFGLIAWRVRQRLMTQPRFAGAKCPRCGSDLRRIRRRWRDRVVNLYVPVRRYQCRAAECTWHGLRVMRSRLE
jgi:hypothetical protein